MSKYNVIIIQEQYEMVVALKTILLYRTPAFIYDGELLSSGLKGFDLSLVDAIRNQ